MLRVTVGSSNPFQFMDFNFRTSVIKGTSFEIAKHPVSTHPGFVSAARFC